MATKSHFWEAMLSIPARCLTASSWPSNQVTSTLSSLPHHSAACLPWAHQVACRPAFENAALSGFSERPISAASAGVMPKPASSAAAEPAAVAAWRRSRLVVEVLSVPDIPCSLSHCCPAASLIAPPRYAVFHNRLDHATAGCCALHTGAVALHARRQKTAMRWSSCSRSIIVRPACQPLPLSGHSQACTDYSESNPGHAAFRDRRDSRSDRAGACPLVSQAMCIGRR